MTYDNWKTTNPDDAYLGDPPCAWTEEWETGFEICEYCGARWPWECDPTKRR